MRPPTARGADLPSSRYVAGQACFRARRVAPDRSLGQTPWPAHYPILDSDLPRSIGTEVVGVELDEAALGWHNRRRRRGRGGGLAMGGAKGIVARTTSASRGALAL